jgi:hypothetical protein
MIIYDNDCEKVRVSKRIANIKEQEQAHILGAMRPLTESQQATIRAGIEQARKQPRAWNYILGDTAFTNGLVRIRYQNGHNKYEYHMGFAGGARKAGEMNSGEDVGDEKLFGFIQRRSG